MMEPKRSEVSGTANDKGLPRSFFRLIQIYSYKAATSLKCNALVAYPIHAVWLIFTPRRRRYLIDHGYTLIGVFPAGTAEVETKNVEYKDNIGAWPYGFTSLEVVTLEKLMSHTSSASIRKERITVLREVMRSILKPLRNCSETGFQVSLKIGKVLRFLWRLVSYCSDILEPKDMSFMRHGAGRYQSCVRCTLIFEDTVQGRKSPSRLVSATTETRRSVGSLDVTARMVRERGQKGKRRWALKKISTCYRTSLR